MKQISYWAKSHKWTARWIIVGCYLLLNLLGWQTGALLQDAGVTFSGTVLTSIITVYLLGLLLYPPKKVRKEKGQNNYYAWQKTCDFLLIASTFWMIVYLANQAPHFPFAFRAQATVIQATASFDDSTRKFKSITEFAAAMKDDNGHSLPWKERKKIMKQQVKEIKKAPELSNSARTFLIVLFVLLAIGLELGVLALACELSCSGSAGAAMVVGIGGTALIILLLVLGIRGLRKKKQKDNDAKANQQPGSLAVADLPGF